MGRIKKPYTFKTDQVITAAQLNAVFDVLYNEFNGSIDDSNIKEGANIDAAKLLNASITNGKLVNNVINDANLDYTSVKVLRVGPNITNNGIRTARGGKAFTYVGGVVTVTVLFSTDSDDGNPQFAAPPRIRGSIVHASDANLHMYRLIDIKASGFSVELRCSAGVASSGTFEWIADGVV